MRRRAALMIGALGVGAALTSSPQAATPTAGYLVAVRDGASVAAVERLAEQLGGRVGFTYRHALHGFSVTLPVPALPQLRALSGIAAVVPDTPVTVAATQPSPPYGLDRIDQRTLPLNGRFRYATDGRAVTAYVLDSGIRRDHLDFAGRVVGGYDTVTAGGRAEDCHGHGTHVAGTLGGTTYGVAKRVRIVPVRVLDCAGRGNASKIVAGLDWVVGHHQAGRPAVANISVEGGRNELMDSAVQRAVSDGVTVVVAAGNGGSLITDVLGFDDACNASPARAPSAITVAATDPDDSRAVYSNRGPCVDIWAPGTDVVSNGIDSMSDTATMSGTSMASPHVAGTAALYLARNPSASPAQVTAALIRVATNGVVTGAADSPNRMVYQAW